MSEQQPDLEEGVINDPPPPTEEKLDEESVKPTGTAAGGTKLPLHPYKIVLLVGSLALCGVALAGIATVQQPEPFFKPVQQFQGEIQFEEMDDEVLVWDDEYSDMSSGKTQAIVEKAQEELEKALVQQGVHPDSVKITSVQPSEPHTIVKNVLTEAKGRMGRMGGGRSYFDYFSSNQWESDIGSTHYDQLSYTDTSTVRFGYEVYSAPYKNADVFDNSAGNWHQLANNMENYLSSEGIDAQFDEDFAPTDNYLSTYVYGAQEHPDSLVHGEYSPIEYESIDCDFDGLNIGVGVLPAECSSSCPDVKQIYGGGNGVFASCTKVCAAAYYYGLIGVNGGKFQVSSMGINTPELGDSSDFHNVKAVEFEVPTFYVKEAEDETNSGSQLTGTNWEKDSSSNSEECNCYEPMIYLYLDVKKINGRIVEMPDGVMYIYGKWLPVYDDMIDLVETTFATVSPKLDVGCVYKLTSHDPHNEDNIGIVVQFVVCSKAGHDNAREINRIGITEFPDKLAETFNSKDGGKDVKMAGFKYERCFQNQLKIDAGVVLAPNTEDEWCMTE